jgi:hypothetical protein
MRAILVLMVSLLACARATGAWAQMDLPDPRLTPGALNPGVTQENIGDTICVAGWTRTVRPPENYTEDLKPRQIREYGYADRRLGHYEEDHLVPLDLGGSPTDPRNLWPEPRRTADGWDADRKDELESLLSGQKANNSNWLLSSVSSDRSGVAKIADWIDIFSNTVTEKTCSNV